MRIYIKTITDESIVTSKEYTSEEGSKVLEDISDIMSGRGLATSSIVNHRNNDILLTKSLLDGKLIEVEKGETSETGNKVKKTTSTSRKSK